MGSAEGALRTAAARTGHSVTEYLDRLNAGYRWCFRDQAWESASEFSRDASRSDGLARCCRRATNAAARRRRVPRPRPAAGRRYVDPRDGDALQARRRVNYLVEQGLLPPPNRRPCTDCGHESVVEGERRHEYDHYLGYAAEHHEEVEPVCTTCHHRREDERRAV